MCVLPLNVKLNQTFLFQEEQSKVFNRNVLMGLIIVTAFLATLIFASGFFIYHRRKRTSGYSKPKFQNDKTVKGIYGFGVANSENGVKNNFTNGYENLTYMVTSHLGKNLVETEVFEDPDGENALIPPNQ